MPAIEASGLSKSFAGRRALWDLSFSVEAGEGFGLLGPNGAGETTALRILAGLISPDAGEAGVAGERIHAGAPGSAALRARIGLLTEQPGFYDRLTALENLVVFGKLQGLTAREAASRAAKLLARFSLASHAARPFAVLSRGMKQKLAIARALLHDPAVILLDEPTVGLDPEATREVRDLIAELSAERRTIVLCTHHLDEVERLCARAAFVAGRLLAVHEVKPLAAGVHRLRFSLAMAGTAITMAEAEIATAGTAITAKAGQALRALPFVRGVRAEGGAALLAELDSPAHAPDAIAALVAAGVRLQAATPVRDPLEEAYLALLAQARAEGLIAA